MSYNGSGVYTLPGAQLANGKIVSATENNQFRNDVATALNVAWTRDGQAPATANIPMGSHKFTGLAAGTGNGDSVRFEQLVSSTNPVNLATQVTGTLPVANGGTGSSTASAARSALGAQETLVSGTNIKTINGNSILGSGDVVIPTTSDGDKGDITVSGSNTVWTIDTGVVTPEKLSTGSPSWGSSGNLLFNSGYGSVATAYGCRAWVNFNGTGTVAIRASGNVSSITDNGTGDYTINFTTAMPDTSYSFGFAGFLSNGSSTNAIVVRGDSTATASTFRAKITTVGLSQVDWDVLDFTFHR